MKKLILVIGSGMDSSRIQVGFWSCQDSGEWKEVFHVPGFCGYHGMALDKCEGDRRTPVGVHGFQCAFGILPDPGSQLPYKELDEGDYWVDDGESSYYNQMVNIHETAVSWNSAEHLIDWKPSYNYSLALDHNCKDRVPGKGSAIFLHGTNPPHTWTEGCIAIPEEQVKLLVQQVDADTKIVIIPDEHSFHLLPEPIRNLLNQLKA